LRKYGVICDAPQGGRKPGEIPTKRERFRNPRNNAEREKNEFWDSLALFASCELRELQTTDETLKRMATKQKHDAAFSVRLAAINGYDAELNESERIPDPDDRGNPENAEKWRRRARGVYLKQFEKSIGEKYKQFLQKHGLTYEEFG